MKPPTHSKPKPPAPYLAKRKADYRTVCTVRQLVDHREPKSHMKPVVDAAASMIPTAGRWLDCKQDREEIKALLAKTTTTPPE